MTKAETDPITDDEFLLRRIRRERLRPDQTPIISFKAFEPRTKGREPDVDGISMFRLACLANPGAIVGDATDNGVVQIPASELRRLGLTINSSPVPSIPGHVVIRELNAAEWLNSKNRLKMIAEELAVVASQPSNILIWPTLE